MQISTGGSDITAITGGVTLNLVTKRGTNEPRGSARYFLTDSDKMLGLFEEADPDIEDELSPGQTSVSRSSPLTRSDTFTTYTARARAPSTRGAHGVGTRPSRARRRSGSQPKRRARETSPPRRAAPT